MPAESLAETLPREQARVRELILIYREIGPAANFAIMMMERSLQAADQAAISGDVIAMLRALEDLRGFKE